MFEKGITAVKPLCLLQFTVGSCGNRIQVSVMMLNSLLDFSVRQLITSFTSIECRWWWCNHPCPGDPEGTSITLLMVLLDKLPAVQFRRMFPLWLKPYVILPFILPLFFYATFCQVPQSFMDQTLLKSLPKISLWTDLVSCYVGIGIQCKEGGKLFPSFSWSLQNCGSQSFHLIYHVL